MGVMTIAIWLSLWAHAAILTIHFEPELKKFRDDLPTLEVMLVNSKTLTAPDKADVLAQANLDRGGNTDQNRKMKTALPAVKQQKAEFSVKPMAEVKAGKKAAKLTAEETKEQKHVAELEKQAQELMTQLNSSNKVESQPVQKAAAKEAEMGSQESPSKVLNMRDLTTMALEMDRLEAIIAKQQDEYQKRPKKRFLGARAKEASDAMYLDAWRQKVERIGNMNYPEAAKAQKIYGQLRMTVSIRSDGSIDSIVIDKSSGSKILDKAAKDIVNMAAPYPAFSPEMKKTTDILGITRTWTFTQEDMLATKGSD
ncbi:MAG: TonB family protein [Methylotenera sp.]|nr:TonB family protein [Methylotenera sp.]MDO9394247.1 TonB family protein [Methylotenera sp.]MDP1523392.1 TonB family protein [Methylotenera sp.]MDP3006130.1 TonB family protein [Methylotenera sp.]MDP3306800.1 TonB family protein [Methylotenera sp.]MDZ4210636.1 TonB family protein [Methylotenera sp.]